MSGLHGVHRRKGAFGRFVRRFLAGEIRGNAAGNAVFVCEGFDRFTREPVRIAQQLFLSLINGDPEHGIAGLEVVTLIDQRRYSANSLDLNIGDLYTSIALMLGAHMESKLKGLRIRETWIKRRAGANGKETGLPSNIYPSWIVRTSKGPQLDMAKAKIIRRIFRMALVMGTMAIAKQFNMEGVPTLTTRKTARGSNTWQHASISALIRGRQVLGEQPVGRIDVDGKRQLTGETNQAYPGAVSEAEWIAANAAIDARQRGTDTGRNRATFGNLFGGLAECSLCHGRMVIRGKGSYSCRRYFGCQNSGDGQTKCTNKKYHRVDKVEADVFAMINDLTWDEAPEQNKAADLIAQRELAKADADKLQKNIDALAQTFTDAPPAIRATMGKLAKDHAAKAAIVTRLDREIATQRIAKPAHEQQQAVQSLAKRLQRLTGADLIAARGRIASLLPRLLTRLAFAPAGVTVTLADGRTYPLGEWAAMGGALVNRKDRKRWDRPVWSDPDLAAAGRRSRLALAEFYAARRRR